MVIPVLCNLILIASSLSLLSMEKKVINIFKEDDKACYHAIDEFKVRTKYENDYYRLNAYADAVKSAVAFGQNMNLVCLGCELTKHVRDVPLFPLFIVMAKEKRCTVLLDIMLQRGANPNMYFAAQNKGARPVSEAITYNALDNARLLLQSGAKPVVEFKLRSDTPDKDPRLSLLVEFGAKPDEIWAGPLNCDKELAVVSQFINLSLE